MIHPFFLKLFISFLVVLVFFLPGISQGKGQPIWLGVPYQKTKLDLNKANSEEIENCLSQLVQFMPKKHQVVWENSLTNPTLPNLAKKIVFERDHRLQSFQNMAEVTHIITEFSDEKGLPRSSLMYFLQAIMESHVLFSKG